MKPAKSVVALVFAFALVAGPPALAVVQAENEFTTGVHLYEKAGVSGALAIWSAWLKGIRQYPTVYSKRAIDLDRKDATDYNNRGVDKSNRGDRDGAIADYNRAIDLNPKLAAAYFNRGIVKSERDDNDSAIADYSRAIKLNPKFTAAYAARGSARSAKGNKDGAITDYSRAIKLDPKCANAYYDRGIAKSDKGDHDGAIADYSHAIELNPKLANAYNNRGIAKSDKGDRDGAIADHSRAIELDPEFATAYTNRGIAKNDKGDHAGAIADYDRAIELDPKFAIAYSNRGNAMRAKGDKDGAIADYSRAIELDPKYPAAYFDRGIAHYLQKNWLKASGDFDAASQQEKPRDYGTLLACVVQTRLGQGEAGRKELRARLDQRRDAKPSDWVSQVGSFLLGTLDEAALIKAADSPDAKKARGQRCEAWYFAGMQRLATSQNNEAANCFRKCIATELKTFTEYQLATAELQWLGEK